MPSIEQKPPDSLSRSEQEAIEILTGYGVDFPAVYIGRARPFLNAGHYDSQKPEAQLPIEGKSAEEIVSYVMELIKHDEEQTLYLERRRKEISLERIYDQLAVQLPQSDPQTAELIKILRQEVERTRFNRGWTPVEVELYATGRSWPDYVGECSIGGQEFNVTAFADQDREGRSVLRVQIKCR